MMISKTAEHVKLSKYLNQNLPQYFPNRSEIIDLIETIAEATLPIRGLLERGITSRELNLRMEIEEPKGDTKNIYDEEQIHEDILTHSIILKALQEADVGFAYIASEESEPILGNGHFGITIDPVDGSSNVKVNRTVGTIVGIYSKSEIVCAFYMLYGIFTNMVLAINGRVAEFILDTTPYSMTFYHFIFLEHLNMPDLEKGGIRCLGGDSMQWSDLCKKYEQKLIDNHFKDRYSGSFVGDFHAIVKYGGVYAYFPSPKGKIRIYYEWLPLAFIAKTLEGQFYLIGDEEDKDKITLIESITPLNKTNIKQIHMSVAGGLLGSKKVVEFIRDL